MSCDCHVVPDFLSTIFGIKDGGEWLVKECKRLIGCVSMYDKSKRSSKLEGFPRGANLPVACGEVGVKTRSSHSR